MSPLRSETSYVIVAPNYGLDTPVSDPGKQYGLGTFDPKHLQRLSREFTSSLRFPGLTIEKGYLIKLLSNTLQIDPSLRPSQIILLPTMVDWEYVTLYASENHGFMLTSCSRSDTGALQGQLAIHTGSSALNFQVCSNFFTSSGLFPSIFLLTK
jgi:hypothetical protein